MVECRHPHFWIANSAVYHTPPCTTLENATLALAYAVMAYSNGSQFCFTAELQSIWLVSWGGGGRPPPLPIPPLNGYPELVRWAMRRRRKRTPTPYPPHPHSELCRVLHSCFPSSQWAVKSSTFLLGLCLLWAGVVKHYTAVPAYWDPRGSARIKNTIAMLYILPLSWSYYKAIFYFKEIFKNDIYKFIVL